jgi:type II secretory pathway component PulF
MIALSQTHTSYLTTATEGIRQLIFLYQVKQFFQKHWIWLLLGVCALGGIAYSIYRKHRVQEQKDKTIINPLF